MQHRFVLGWVLAGAFCASLSCGGGNSAGPPGFGLTCKSEADCTAYKLLCGSEAKCVECLDAGDCKSNQICATGLCKVEHECKDTRDCGGAGVCNEDTGVCVDCVTSSDCKKGQACSNNTCSTRPACDYTSDCSGGLVCDAAAHICVACRTDKDCGYKRVCEDYECVPEPVIGDGGNSSGGSSSGSGGKASAGSGGKATAGTSSGGTGTGGIAMGGMSGFAGTAGAGGSGGMAGSVGEGGAGGAVDCGCTGNDVCTPDLRCVKPTLIDDLLDCDDQIISIEGRKGNWAAAADTGVNLMYGFTDPGSGWVDRTCAAWASGGEITVNNPNTKFAFIGFRLNVDALNQGLAYDLSGYTGLQIKLEAPSPPSTSVQVVLKTTGNGSFQFTLGPIAGSNLRTAPFAMMKNMANAAPSAQDLSTASEVQFSVTDPKSFKLAVHSVSLY